MANAMKAVWQAVDEEETNELVRMKRHQPGRVATPVITPAEGYPGLVSADEATVGDGDPVCVAAEIGQDMFGRSERRLGIDDPVFAPQLGDRFGKDIGVI
ncbi:hypothetical protein J2W40_003916 [Sphingobium xenophagum]|uniref:Uncharacterized protein n=1 Tax=Sphingobium xenophagum TaxID=121428 RepID=A0ABU1X662_SPHXE|nr:hypothetical protein [Sphingobium xenophagum]